MFHLHRSGSATVNYVADPHTAVAMAAAEKLGYYAFLVRSSVGKMIPIVILAAVYYANFKGQ